MSFLIYFYLIIFLQFYISTNNDIHSFADAIRKHWGVENNLHAPLDIVFKEDANRTLEKNGARNLGILKRICLAVLKFVQTYYDLSLNKIRFLLSIDFEKEIENIFKLLNTNDIAKLLEKTHDLKFHAFILVSVIIHQHYLTLNL